MTLSCHDGRAWAQLELSLGQASGPGRVGGGPRTRNPSYKRRQEARKTGRQNRTAEISPNDPTKASDDVINTAVQAVGSKDAENVINSAVQAGNVTNSAEQVENVTNSAEQVENVTNSAEQVEDVTKPAVQAEIVTNSAVQADVSAPAAHKLPVMSRVELDEADTAELAAVELDRGELGRRRKEKLKTLYERFENGGRDFYRCLACDNPRVKWMWGDEGRHTRFLTHMENHIINEHMDKLDEVDSMMRREVLARIKANYGVEDTVRWEQYYRTNCKLRRPV